MSVQISASASLAAISVSAVRDASYRSFVVSARVTSVFWRIWIARQTREAMTPVAPTISAIVLIASQFMIVLLD
jgi:hypothetical protein